MSTEAGKPLKLFYCYAREDKTYRDELDNHLANLKRSHQITSWSDREISAGVDWEATIDRELGTAHIILLLVSFPWLIPIWSSHIYMTILPDRDPNGHAIASDSYMKDARA